MNIEQNSNQNNKSEEVDLIIFFNYIGDRFEKLFRYISGFFKTIFSTIIYLLKTLFNSWKMVLGILIIAYGIGYYMETKITPIYTTSMLVEPYFDSKYQLVANINYFNALISNKDYDMLKQIFNVDTETIKNLKRFKIEPGPETENDRILQYLDFKDKFVSEVQVDNPLKKGKEAVTLRKNEVNVSFEDFVKNRSIYAGKYFLITATASKDDIFKSIEEGVYKSFQNSYSEKIMERDTLLVNIQRKSFKEQLKEIDALKTIYIDVLKDASTKKPNSNVKVSEQGVAFSTETQVTREYELLAQELVIRDKIRKLDEQLVRKDDFYDVITGFQKVGNKSTSWTQRHRLIYPLLAFALLCGFFLVRKLINYTYSYED
jgi:hypothetical protein